MIVLVEHFYLKLIGLYHHHRLTKMLYYWSTNDPFTAVISPTIPSAIVWAIVILLYWRIVIVKQMGFVSTFVIPFQSKEIKSPHNRNRKCKRTLNFSG